MSVDTNKGFILKATLSEAKRYEGHVLEEELPNEQDWVFADKAYESKANDRFLKAKGIKNGIMKKGSRYKKTKPQRSFEKSFNQ
jgi:IS5 family transposase